WPDVGLSVEMLAGWPPGGALTVNERPFETATCGVPGFAASASEIDCGSVPGNGFGIETVTPVPPLGVPCAVVIVPKRTSTGCVPKFVPVSVIGSPGFPL